MKPGFLVILGLLCLASPAAGKSEHVSYSLMLQAHAPNAGGQDIYSLKRSTTENEYSVFGNTYLLAGGYPLVGGIYAKRLGLCGPTCVVQGYLQLGAGISTGGPLLEISWTGVFLWVARLDFATQLFFTTRRMVSWSVPVWLGLSIPMP